jgi:hypothetical protein
VSVVLLFATCMSFADVVAVCGARAHATSQLLDEMMDYSIPFTTEPNNLRDIVAPPNVLTAVAGSSTSPLTSLPFCSPMLAVQCSAHRRSPTRCPRLPSAMSIGVVASIVIHRALLSPSLSLSLSFYLSLAVSLLSVLIPLFLIKTVCCWFGQNCLFCFLAIAVCRCLIVLLSCYSVKYRTNEIFVDLVESIHAIIES